MYRRCLLVAVPVFGAAILALPPTAAAQPLAQGAGGPVALPPEVRAELPQAAAGPSARLRFFGLDVYDGRLFVPPGFRAAHWAVTPLALELTYLRSLKGALIAERSLTEMRRSGDLTAEQQSRWLAAMVQAFPDVRAGDRITGMHQPGHGARFWFNAQPRSGVADALFSERFFGIWLAESTSEPRLRNALLQGLPA